MPAFAPGRRQGDAFVLVGEGEVGCGVNCDDDGALAPMYVEVTAEGNVELMFTYPGIPDPVPISSTSTMRLR